jgi:hypothetical protein
MTTGVACPVPILQFFDNTGKPAVGGSVLTQVGGVNAATYQDSGLSIPLPNPIPLNSRGEISNSAGQSQQLFLPANTVYTFTISDVNGNILDTPTYVSGFQLQATSIGSVLYPQTQAESTVGVTPTNLIYPPGNAWRFLNAAQLSDVQGFTFLQDCTTALQNWLDCAYVGNIKAYLPAGGYLISSTLTINHGYTIDGIDYRGRRLTVYGDGAGSVQARSVMRTSVLQGNGNFTLLRWNQYLGVGTDSQPYEITGIRFEQLSGSCTVAVVQLDVLGYFSWFHDCEIWQAGSGDGLRLLQLTQAVIERCTIQNRDWVAETPWNSTTAYVVGNQVIQGRQLYSCITANTNNAPPNAGYWSPFSRVGVGVDIFGQYNAGLGTVRNVSVRGFEFGFLQGAVSTGILQGVSYVECDVSNVLYGIWISNYTSGQVYYQDNARIERCYFEGCEGDCIVDYGTNTIVRDCVLVTAPYVTAIDGSLSAGGSVYSSNEIAMGTQYVNNVAQGITASVGIYVAPSSTNPVTIVNNSFDWAWSGGSLAGCCAIKIGAGVDPYVTMSGNTFSPVTQWTGGAGTQTIIDNSTTGDGSGTTGVLGYAVGQDNARAFPVLRRGALYLYGNPVALGNSAVTSNILYLGEASYYLVNCTTSQSINAIGGLTTGQMVTCRVTNGNLTFNPTINLKLAGSTNVTSGNNGITITFLCRPGSGVAEEVSRTVY